MSRIQDPKGILKNPVFSHCDQYAVKSFSNFETIVTLNFEKYTIKYLGDFFVFA